MRNLLLSGLLLIMIACGEKPNAEISGEIKESANTKVYLEQIDVDAVKTIDSVKIDKNGHFTFKLKIDLPVFYALRFSNNERVNLVVSPDEKLDVSGTLTDIQNNYWVDGSENSLWIKLLVFQLNRTTEVTDSVSKAYQALPKTPEYDEQRKAYEQTWKEALQKQVGFTREFIMNHAISPASYYALYQKINPQMFIMDEIEDYHYFKVVASSMNAIYPESPYTKALMNHLKQISQAIRGQQLINVISNTAGTLPDIELPDKNGNPVSLKKLNKKLIVLDFNLLTAKESQGMIRDMKRVYEKFRNRGVEVYQVCLDKSKLIWEHAVRENNINWISVWDENGLQSRAARSWNIKEIPANYIINEKQEIVGKNIYGERLEDRLNELLKQ